MQLPSSSSVMIRDEPMLGIPLGLLYANFSEALFHRYVLHGLGKNPESFWAFHWHEHHREARRNAFRDDNYLRSPWAWHSLSKERLAIAASVALHLPLFPVAPFFVGTLVYCAVKYHRVHARAHLDPDWGRKNVPWHYDHHMAPNQNANWGIVRPWYDQIMGTRLPYSGTSAERHPPPRAAKGTAPFRNRKPSNLASTHEPNGLASTEVPLGEGRGLIGSSTHMAGDDHAHA